MTDDSAVRDTYSVEEVAQRLGVSRGSVYHAVQRGEIFAIHIGRRILIPRNTVDRLLHEPHVRHTEEGIT